MRVLIKSSLPRQFSKLAGMYKKPSDYSFGDSVSDTLDSLNRENKIKYLLKDN